MIEIDPRQWLVAAAAPIRDIGNRLRYGPKAPKSAERIWVSPSEIRRVIRKLPPGINRLTATGRVLDMSACDIAFSDLEMSLHFRSAVEHWRLGRPWALTEDYRHQLDSICKRGKAGARCRNEIDLRERYRVLDDIFEEARKLRMFRTRKQLNPKNFREFGGIQIAILADGEPVLSKAGGYHRLAIAQLLELDIIPAQIDLVDVHAIEMLDRFRDPLALRRARRKIAFTAPAMDLPMRQVAGG